MMIKLHRLKTTTKTHRSGEGITVFRAYMNRTRIIGCQTLVPLKP